MKARYIPSIASGVRKEGENNDCFVRAVSNATGIDYDEVHAVCKQYGRKNGKGTEFETIAKVMKHFNLEGMTLGSSRAAYYVNYFFHGFRRDHTVRKTLSQVTRELTAGKYILLIKGHATALVEGGIVDLFDNKAMREVYGIIWQKNQFDKVKEVKEVKEAQ